MLDYLTGLLLLTPVVVTLATALVFWADGNAGGGQFQLARFRTLFWDYLRHGWKFPAVATLIFGAAALLYRVTKDRLENSNRELQDTVNLGAAERESQEQELQRAREIQEGLLPKTIPQIQGFEIAGAWEPARKVSGDYFDVIELGSNKLAICIADVVGKGVAAALLMANVQAAVRAFAAIGISIQSLPAGKLGALQHHYRRSIRNLVLRIAGRKAQHAPLQQRRTSATDSAQRLGTNLSA